MIIRIKTIPHRKQRYETSGDYWTDENDDEQIRVSEMDNWKYEILVVIHELIEDYLCKSAGIKEEDITKFDIMYEEERLRELHSQSDEPGFDKRAPYKRQHTIADKIERMIAKELKVNFKKYNAVVNKL